MSFFAAVCADVNRIMTGDNGAVAAVAGLVLIVCGIASLVAAFWLGWKIVVIGLVFLLGGYMHWVGVEYAHRNDKAAP